jgi:CO dehydrogenase/acetyl-CoA synthase delta subunit
MEKNTHTSSPSEAYEAPVFNPMDLKNCPFVKGFLDTPVGVVPLVRTRLVRADLLGMLRVRLGICRNDYRVNPGLYGVGNPDPESPVLVTANYKLSFDHVRQEIQGLNAWILVLDTCGINVWCAAGKKTFSTEELGFRLESCGLKKVVSHRRLILPQLGAAGVSAWKVRAESGFSVQWGPIRAADLPAFLKNNCQAVDNDRMVTFHLKERLALIPVEIGNILKPSFWILSGLFLLSGVGRDIFSFSAAWNRGSAAASAYCLGLLGGILVVPLLLPWLPGRMFYVKGLVAGLPLAALAAWGGFPVIQLVEATALIFFCLATSSYTAMKFTGSTPFTSPSGVKIEVRQGLLVQSLFMGLAMILWLFGAFSG